MKRPILHRLLLAGGALLLLLGGDAPAQAQLVAEPGNLSVMLPQGETGAYVIMLRNTGGKTVSFCLSFERPLQRSSGAARLGATALGEACGEIGEVLVEQDFGIGDPYGLAMTPNGRLFNANNNSGLTFELTPELEVVRSFEHPEVAEVSTFPETKGVAYDPETGRLWWLNIEEQGQDFRRALLLEGDLDGIATGRRIALPPLASNAGEEVTPSRLSYDPAMRRFFFTGFNRVTGETTIWAADSLGQIVDGYPVSQMARPGGTATGPDAHGGWDPSGGLDGMGAPGEPEAVRLEVAVAPPSGGLSDQIAVVDPLGRDLGIGTPLPDLGGANGSSLIGEPLRSRVDPSGVLYSPFTRFFETEGIVGIRPHPLPPSWLALSQWDGTLGPGESTEITLTFSAGARAVGNTYTAVLQVFEAETGNAIEVPLSLDVAPPVSAEDAASPQAEVLLSVYPNPTAGRVSVRLLLPRRAEVQVVVYDVLGREVARLADQMLEAGRHGFALDGTELPAGVYLVRAIGQTFSTTRRIILTR